MKRFTFVVSVLMNPIAFRQCLCRLFFSVSSLLNFWTSFYFSAARLSHSKHIMIPKMIGRGLISVLLALLAPIAASAEDAPTTKLHTIVTSSSQSVLFDVGINDKPSQTLEWSEATGTLTAKVTYSELSGHEAVETAPSDCRTLFFPFPTVKLDAQNNLGRVCKIAER